MKTLVIAEKPSVAQDIARALSEKFESHKTHHESDNYIVSYAVGHLLTICNPKEMDERLKEWTLDNLPIIPEKFEIKPLPKTKAQLSVLGKLMKRKDVDVIVNACDAGREGELIFRYILQYVSGEKPLKKQMKRLWLQSMTQTAIREGFAHLRREEEMNRLAAAAVSRSEADWLVGINSSRALTGYKSKRGGFFLTPCGRVQTPTLSMLVNRERERDAFVPRPYWEVYADFAPGSKGSADDEYKGRWFQPDFKKSPDDEHQRAERIWDKERAEEILDKCRGKKARVEETQKPSSQSSPTLYDLTTLQREANQRFGFSAKNTLGIAQALYERHKALTYPRTDSRYLPEDYLDHVKDLMKNLGKGEFKKFSDIAIKNGYVRPDKRIFDNARISDHHAIIPTTVIPSDLSEPEKRIYQMVTQRFLAVFFPPARFLNTTRISIVEDEHFKTEGKVLQEPGWKIIYGIDKQEESILPALRKDAEYFARDVSSKEDVTRPAPHLNESTLLSIMESAGKLVEDEELREAMKERGLGTPATRAAIIEGLIADKYVVREGRDLLPTAKGIDLFQMLTAMELEEMVSAELTGEWEHKLNRIEKGIYTRDEFMNEIVGFTRRIVEKIKHYDEDAHREKAPFTFGGQDFYETFSKYESADGSIIIRKMLGGRQMSAEEVLELLEKRSLGPLQGFRSKQGKPFSAVIKFNAENRVEFVFEDNDTGPDGQALDVSTQEPLGVSPVDGTKVYETLTSYVSESALEEENKKGLRVNKVILGKPIDRENMRRMLSGEKTELIKAFQSSKTRRFFDAYLSLSKDGKIKFEFPPRQFRGKAAAKKEEA